jgi:hypothetical protein
MAECIAGVSRMHCSHRHTNRGVNPKQFSDPQRNHQCIFPQYSAWQQGMYAVLQRCPVLFQIVGVEFILGNVWYQSSDMSELYSALL